VQAPGRVLVLDDASWGWEWLGRTFPIE